MNKEIKKKWLKALESGEYKKACGRLKRGDGYCCLGVLTDLYNKEHERFKVTLDSGILSPVVMNWAGIDLEHSPLVDFYDEDGRNSLVNINDSTDSFDEVIEAIRKYF